MLRLRVWRKHLGVFALSLLLVALNAPGALAQGPEIKWTRTAGGNQDDFGYSVQPTSDGGFVAAGETYSIGAGLADAYLVKAGGAGYWDYATQSDTQPTSEAPAGGVNSQNGDLSIDATYGSVPVGSYTASVSAYGTYDQTGNIFEYTETLVDMGAGTTYDHPVRRGGSFYCNAPPKYDSAADRYADGDFYAASPSNGMRLGYIPEPATLAVLGIGALLMLLKRRR